MRFALCSFVTCSLFAWQAAACLAVGPMGFSDPAPASAKSSASSSQTGDLAAPPLLGTSTDVVTPSGTGNSNGCSNCGGHHCFFNGIFCNMPPISQYPSPWDRYYYFRPYNYFQIPVQQQIVAGWGQDPRNISDNRFFQAIYERVEKQQNAPKPEAVRLPPTSSSDAPTREPPE